MSSACHGRLSGARALLRKTLPYSQRVDFDENTRDVDDQSQEMPPTSTFSTFSYSAQALPFILPQTSFPSHAVMQVAPPSLSASLSSSRSPIPSQTILSTIPENWNKKPEDASTQVGASKSTGLSITAIAGTVIALLLFSVLAVFLHRKWLRNSRIKLRKWADEEVGTRISPWVDYKEKVIREPEPAAAGPKIRTNGLPPSPRPSPLSNISFSALKNSALPIPVDESVHALPVDAPEYIYVLSTFIPTLPDELHINVGDSLRVLAEFDDGWALCQNSQGEKGMVPLECLGQVDFPNVFQCISIREDRKSSRISSLAVAPRK